MWVTPPSVSHVLHLEYESGPRPCLNPQSYLGIITSSTVRSGRNNSPPMREPGVIQRDAWQHSESSSQVAAEVYFDGSRYHAKVKINSALYSGESFNGEAEAIAFLDQEFEGARQHVLNLTGDA